MKGFIEIHNEKTKKAILVNVRHIVEVMGNTIYTDDIPNFADEWTTVKCVENYEEIKSLINEAME